MSLGADLPALRVEQALRLLPDVDALAPLRAFLVAASRSETRAEPYRTVGDRKKAGGPARRSGSPPLGDAGHGAFPSLSVDCSAMDTERRSKVGDRRFGFGRRIADRRMAAVPVPVERRASTERRSSGERRVTYDRRASIRRFSTPRGQGQVISQQ